MTVAVAVAAAKTSTGNQDITTTDLGGLTPKAALFIYARTNADGTTHADGGISFGACDATAQWAFASFIDDNAVGSDLSTAMGDVGKTNKCVTALKLDTTIKIHSEAAFVAFISNGVRINWTTATADGWLLTVMFFAGTDWSAKVTNAISVGTDAVSLGFQPTIVICGGKNTGSPAGMDGTIYTGRARTSFGAQAWSESAGRTGAVQWTWTWPFSSNQEVLGSSAGPDTTCGNQFEVGFGGQYAIALVRTVTGFTFQNDFMEADQWGFLALEWTGGDAFCKLLEIGPSTGAQSFTGFGLIPQAALILPSGNTSNGGPQFGRKCGIIAATPTKAGGLGTASRSDGLGGNYIDKSVAAEDTIRLIDQAAADWAVATVQSFDADGVTLNFSNAPPVTSDVPALWPIITFGPSSSGGERTFGWIID